MPVSMLRAFRAHFEVRPGIDPEKDRQRGPPKYGNPEIGTLFFWGPPAVRYRRDFGPLCDEVDLKGTEPRNRRALYLLKLLAPLGASNPPPPWLNSRSDGRTDTGRTSSSDACRRRGKGEGRWRLKGCRCISCRFLLPPSAIPRHVTNLDNAWLLSSTQGQNYDNKYLCASLPRFSRDLTYHLHITLVKASSVKPCTIHTVRGRKSPDVGGRGVGRPEGFQF